MMVLQWLSFSYSYLRASIGSSFDADLAGNTPKDIPMAPETPTAIIIA
jgi:hypothetical protein